MTATPPAPTVTAHTDASPCPRVEVLVTPMPADAASITVWRSWAGSKAVVRNASGALVSGDFLVVDYEVPFGTDVTYTCQTSDSTGAQSAVSAPSAVVNLGVADAWLMDPLDPESALLVALRARDGVAVAKQPGLMQLTYSSDMQIVPLIGQDLPIAVGTARRQASGIPVVIWAASDQSDQLRQLVMQALHLCLRVPHGKIRPLAGLVYVAAGDITEAYAPAPLDRSIWNFTATSVRAPGLDVVVPVRTYDDLPGEAATYDGLAALYATYIDLQRGS